MEADLSGKIQNWWIQPESSAQPPWKLATAPFVWSQRCCLISHFCISAPNPSDLQPVELCRNYPRLPAGGREEKQPLFLPARRPFCLSQSHSQALAGGHLSGAAKHAGCKRRNAGGGQAGGTGSEASRLWQLPGAGRDPRRLRSLPARC